MEKNGKRRCISVKKKRNLQKCDESKRKRREEGYGAEIFFSIQRVLGKERDKRGDVRKETSLKRFDLSHWMTLM